MPNPWKKSRNDGGGGVGGAAAGISRLISGLRPDRGAAAAGSSLVVQTGFPTSLADLVVKNRDRLKKPSRKKKPSLSSDLDSTTTTSSFDPSSAPVAAVASVPSLPPAAPRRRCVFVEDSCTPIIENTRSCAVAEEIRFATPSSVERKTGGLGVPSPAATGAVPRQRGHFSRDRHVPVIKSSGSHENEVIPSASPWFVEAKRSGFGFGFGLLLAKMIVLVALAIERKKLVAGITLTAFNFWLLDSVGCRVFGFFKPCSVVEKNLNSDVQGLKLEERGLKSDVIGLNLEQRGLVSLTREVWIESHSDITGSERSSLDSIDLDQGRELLLERKDNLGVGKNDVEQRDGSSGNSKKKKLLRKFVPKKFRKRKDGKDDKVFISDSSGRGVSDKIEEEVDGEEEDRKEEQGLENSDENVLSSIALSENVQGHTASDVAVNHESKHVEVVQENECTTKLRAYHKLAFFAVILLGLVGGKGVAMVLTLSWFLSRKFFKEKRMNLVA